MCLCVLCLFVFVRVFCVLRFFCGKCEEMGATGIKSLRCIHYMCSWVLCLFVLVCVCMCVLYSSFFCDKFEEMGATGIKLLRCMCLCFYVCLC